MPRDPETTYLDSGGTTNCGAGTIIAAFLNGRLVATIPLTAELWLCDGTTGNLVRRITGGDNLDTIINPTF